MHIYFRENIPTVKKVKSNTLPKKYRTVVRKECLWTQFFPSNLSQTVFAIDDEFKG